MVATSAPAVHNLVQLAARKQLARARRKLAAGGDAIITVRSVGYRFDPSRLAARSETHDD